MSSKLEEAKEHVKAAEKALKTSMLKWKPDFDSAADEYNQAAQCYRIARDLQSSRACHLKAAEYYEKNGSFFHAGKALETAIIVSKEIMTPEELTNLAQKSCHYYQQHGSGDSGATVLEKTAKIIEDKAPELSLSLYQMAAEVSATESGEHQSAEYISKASRLCVKLELYDQAIESIRREIGFHQEHGNIPAIGRLTVALVLVQLARGDSVAAEKEYKEWGNNCEQPEMQTIEELIAAYDEGDRAAAKRALANPFIRHMDVEYSRLSTIIALPEALELPPRPVDNAAAYDADATRVLASKPQAADDKSLPVGPPPAVNPPEDDEDDLC